MLQPRVHEENRFEMVEEIVNNKTEVGRRRKMTTHSGNVYTIGLYAILSLVFLTGLATCQESHIDDEIAADRVKRDIIAGDGDLTTVLLVDNQKLNKDINARNGRYLNVKPVIGLLTSTARTFIQDGVTTEYATEILGTTLDNGRVYAQLLTKSSLVLYDKPVDEDSQKKTRLPFEMDDRNKWNLEQSFGDLDRDHYVIKNTDYVSPKDGLEMFTVFASKPAPGAYATVWNPTPTSETDVTTAEDVTEPQTENSRIQGLQDVPRYSELDALNFLDPLPSARERKISAYKNSNIEIKHDERNNKAINFNSNNKETNSLPSEKTQLKGIEPVKVNPNIKLPTYTVKNEFSPIFYYIDNVESKTEKSNLKPNYLKNAKKLFGHKEEIKPLKTLTYYGFSNFVTVVGDTVIVFAPSTTEPAKEIQEEITPSAKAEVLPNVATKIKTYLSSDLNMVTKTMFGHQLNMETALPTFVMGAQDLGRSSKALINDDEILKDVLYEKPIVEEDQNLNLEDQSSRIIASLKEGLFKPRTQISLSKDVIQPSEASYSTIQRTHATEKLEINSQTIREDKTLSITPTEQLVLLKPSTVSETVETEEDSTVIDTTTEISPDDEDITENDEVEMTTENDYETSPYTEDTLSTPQIEEEEEEEEHKEQVDATCTGGIIPVSTMTTAYKTLTYVTSYFIPLEGTETSTSLKSDVVVTSEIGYLTNLACKSDEIVEISPTATLDVQIEPTKLVGRVVSDGKSEETPQVADVTEASPPVLTTTPKSTEDKNEEVTENTTTEKAQKVEKSETTTLSEKHVEEITQNSLDDKTTVNSSPTEQLVTTSDSHMEMSITTEESTVSIDSRNNIETTTESKEEKESTTENLDEGEIDLIFKTLYTTYTYFTTYFQGSTSTVSSSKAVITNVITSTLDLSEIDPSIFNAIESSDYLFKATQREELGEIQPTSVGVGRPTQTFAINSIIDLVQHRQVIDSVQNDPISNSKISTPELNNEKILEDFKADGVKTFYTTYTFFTTLYVEQDANICSRTEVYTNYVGPSSLIPTKTNEMVTQKTKTNEIDFNNCKKVPAAEATTKSMADKDDDDLDGQLSKPQYHIYTNLDRPNKKNEVELNNYEESNEIVLNNGDSMLVTDVKSSSSKGDHQIIDNSVLDDQISSESNIEEIMPSPTLLLQTSYTTFTYFTTMYIGKDSSKVKSRLETVTNVVTETLDPKSTEVEETNLPITYYTTFTYWTTLYKDKTTTITSREDIISNVVTPTVQQVTVNPIDTSPIDLATVQIAATNKQGSGDETDIKPSTTVDDLLVDDGKATFFTTYTYFTTFYTGNTSELRSSLETITNIVDNTKDLVENQLGARAVGQKPAPNNLVDTNDEKIVIKTTKLTDEIIPTKIGSNVIVATQIVGTYENVLSPSKEPDTEKRIISSQVAIISGDSTIVTNGQNKSEDVTSTTKEDEDLIGTTPGTTVLEGSVTDPTLPPDEDGSEEEDGDSEDGNNSRKKSRLTFSTKKRTYTPIITPFASRNRPTFSPKRVSLTSGAATITRSDFTPTITATPALKVSKASGFGANRKQPNSAFNRNQGGSRRFSRVSTGISATASAQATRGFGRGRSTEIQPTNARRGGFRTASGRPAVAEFSTRGPGSRIRPTLSSRYRGSKQTTTPSLNNEEDSTVTENPLGSTDDAETSTQSLDGNESGFRKTTNPLLRFRRPPLNGRSSVSTTPRTTTQGTTRRGSFNRNRAGATSTTPRSTQRTTQNPLFALRNRQRPNSLFPPRGLINKQPEPQPEEENESDQGENEDTDDLEEESIGEDSDYESSDRQESQVATTTTTVAPRRISNTPSIRPFVGFKRRTKRQADYGSRRSYSNFRRPTARTSKPEPVKEPEPEVVTTPAPRTRKQGRFSSRNSAYQGNSKATARSTATTKAPSSGRQPFILRGDSKTQASSTSRPSFRTRSSRPVKPVKPSSSPAANLRPKVPRLKTFTTAGTEPTRASNRNSARTRTTNRSRSTSRYRTTSNDIVDNNYVNYQIPNDGKLTITHKIPMEVTIPVINGQLTEYKNVLTAKPSIEVLQPNQYSTTKNAFGSQYIVLVSESSEPAENGATKVIQFILHETPTTSIIFTPTTIRGRKTSFSHVIPSTVYDVERVTSTVQPQINANVPLANILLSQLLLGNIGMPQPINPLLALQGQPGVPASPTTEFKTRTTTYVTTVTDAKSTVIPITFRGKEILTTIIDSRVDVITATEFITETVVVTPTPGLPNQNQNQLNSILLLLQQPQFQQQQTTASPLLGLNPDLNLLQNNQQLYNNDLLNSPKPEVLDVKDPEDYLGDYVEEEITPAPKRIQRRKFKTKKVTPPQQQTSVITLYVSGRTPGEFSTVLSTVVVDETQSIQKREAVYFEEFDVNRSDLPNYAEVLMASQSDMMLDNFLMPAMNDMVQNSISHSETQSLESIMGEVSKYMAMDSISSIVETAKSDPTVVYVLKESDVDKMTAFTPVYGYEDSSWHPVEGRGFLYNEDGVRFPNDRAEPRQRHVLATRVMSNGVEVIVANGLEKSADKDAKSKLLRIMTTQDLDKTTTLAPSTVKNNVRMTVSPEDQARNNHTSKPIHSHPRQQSLLSSSMSTSFEPYVAFHHPNTEMIPHHRHNFVIKTCYTTYTYLTTTVQKMRTTVSTYETVVSTITTEPIDFETSTATIDPQATQLQLFQATKSLDIPILQPKIDKRIDEAKPHADHDVIQPSEVTPGTTCSMASCPCTVTLTESLKNNLKTKIVNDIEEGEAPLQLKRSPFKPTKYASTIVDIAPTSLSDYKKENKPNKHKNEQSRPNSPPSEKVVQKYTEISSDAPNDANKKNDKTKINNRVTSIESEKTSNKRNSTKLDDKRKPQETPDKNKEPQKVNKNKFEVADLLKLGTLSIKRLAPMIEQMTGSLIRRQEQNKQIPSTVRPATKLTPYIVNKRVDDFPALRNDQKTSGSSQFPIYIPVDEKELETAESQNIFFNSTLQQNLAWSSQNSKNSRTNLVYSKTIHESPLLNGGIPISPGEIITANSDVIVGKPAVGGPNIGHINKPNIKINNGQNQNFHTDSHSQSSDYQDVRTKPPQRGQGIKQIPFIREDDSYDLRPPMISPPRVSYPQKDNQNIPSGIGPFNPNNQNQHNQNQHSQNQHGQNQHGQNQHGQNQHGQNQHGQNQHGQIQHGQNQNVQNQHGQNQHGQNQHGQNQNVQNQHGQNQHGQNQHGQNQHGQNQHGQNQHGQNQHSQHHHNQNQQNQNKQNQNQHIQNLHGQNQHSQNQHNQNQHNQFNQNQFNQNQYNQIKPQNIGQQEFNKNEKIPQFDSNRPNTQNKPPHNVFVNHIGGTIHSADSILENHGRPAFLDYIPALDTPASYQNYIKNNLITRKTHDDNANYQNTLTKNKIDPSKLSQDKHNFLTAVPNSNKKNKDAPEPILLTDLAHKNTMKPFLVDIQPSRVANVIIPHGSTTALIFAGSSEPHKNGEYIDDPLPYPEPGYFGSFSIDAPHLTSVHIGGTIPLQSHIQDSKASSSVRQETSYKNNPDPHIVNHGISGLNKDIKPPQGQRWKYEDVGQKQQPPLFHGPPNHGKMPPPISNQESNMHFGPHFVVKKPEKMNNEFGGNINAPTRNQFFNGPNNIKTTTADYEADLAVPPPPPSSIQVKYESNVGVLNSNFNKFKNGENPNKFAMNPPPAFMNQERPPQNIQFGQHNNDNQQKITSEIYFASTSSHGDAGQKIKPFTLNIPAQTNYNNQNSNNRPSFDNNNKFINTFDGGLVTLNAGTKVNIPNVPAIANPAFNSRPPASNINNMQYAIPQGEGLITLNAGASVFNPNLPEQTISGSLTHQQIKNSYNLQTHNVKEFHSHEGESTGIPIGTNFAIKVEPQRIEEYNPNVKINNGAVSTADFKPQEKVPEIIVGGNSWKAGTSNHGYEDDNSNNVGGIPDSVQNGNQKVHVVHASTYNNYNYDKTKTKEQDKKVSFYNATSSANSHANFPVIKEHVDSFNHFGQTVVPNIQSVKFVPSESTENKFIPLNQQGSFEKNVNFFNNYTNQRPIVVQSTSKKPNLQIQHRPISIETKPHIATVHKERPIELPSKIPTYQSNNFKVESTTHNIIPLKFDFESQRYGNINGGYGQKIPFVEMPASNSNWQSNPVLKPKDKPIPIFKDTLPEFMAPPPLTTPAYNPAYIPSNYNNKRQPVYDIPTRDTYDLTKVTLKPLFNTTKYAPTQNNYISNNDYKTIDESDYQNVKENGELTQESMKIPILTSTLQPLNDKITISFRPLKNSTRPSDEILIGSGNDYTSYNIDHSKTQFNANDNSGSQTEKPFNENKYKEVSLVTLPGTKQTTQSTYDPPNFSQMAPRPFAVSENSKDNINNYDIYKPRPFQRPIHKDDKFVLNIGEVPAKSTTSMTSPRTTQSSTTTTTKPPNVRPQFSVKNNSLTYKNDLDKIITSSVNVATNKPFQVINITTEKPITFTTPKAKNSTIISNLSPPPPTMDYSFKPTIKDDAIVGMSPPPRTPAPKVPTKDYTKYTDVSTFRPGHNSMKNPYKRPGDFYRITTRPFTRHTGPPTPVPSRSKVTAGTTITRIVYPSRSTIPSWKNPTRVETRVPSNKQTNQHNKTPLPGVSIINTTPLSTVGPDIMHPDIYPEETIGLPPTLYKSDPVIIPDKVKPPTIYPTVVHQIKSTLSSVKPVQPTYIPTLIQASENFLDENAIKKTDTLKVAPTIKETQLKPIKTQINKPTLQTSFNSIENEITIKPIHHAGNEIKQSDDDIPLKNPEPATAITFTTTLAQPASTVMTTRFVTLTHTLTVTQTKTSLVSPVVGSTTQTLVLTDTHTSTIVDVVTEIHTLVQPTTIVQTITEHVSIPSWETKYPKVPIEPTNVRDHPYKTKQISKLDDLSLTPEEEDLIIMPDNSTLDIFSPDGDTSYPEDNDTIFVVMNKSQNGGSSPTIDTAIDEENGDEITRNEEVGGEGVAQVLLGEILLAGTPFLETAHAISPTGVAYGKECQPDCKASRNERCQRMHGLMKCVCRPGFARMFPDRPCKPTYTYSMKLALSRQGNERLVYQDAYADQNSKDFQDLAMAAHEGINRMVMQSDLRDVYHGVHINGFQPVKIPLPDGMPMNGVLNDFYVQLSDNAHETRLKEVIEKYLRNNNYSLGGTNVFAAGELVDKLEVGDFNECMSNQFHDCSEHAECFNLRATYTCSCKEGYADLSVNPLYPGRICSAEPVGCEKCHYHGTCYTRDDSRVLCECFQWYAGESCQINLKVILISLATLGAILFTLLLICLIMTCAKRRRPKGHKHMDTMRRSQAPVMSSCIGNIPTIHQGHQSKMHSTMDKRALIQERGNDSGGEGSSIHNVSLPYIPAKKISQISHKSGKKMSLVDEVQSREKKPFTLMIPRAKYHPAPTTSPHMMNPNDIRDSNHGKRKSSGESSNETKLLSYLDAGPGNDNLTRRKQSNESSYSMNKGMPQKYSTGALVSAGFKVSTTVMGGPEHDSSLKDMQDDASSVAKSNTLPTLDMQSQFNSLRKAYSQEDINDWTDAERRIGELTMSEARSFDGTLVKPSTKLMRSTTGSNKSSAHYTQHEANTMAERDLGSTFLLPHVHLYKPDMGSDVSEFDSL